MNTPFHENIEKEENGPGFLNRKRAQRLLAKIGADALLLLKPGSITYASGAHPGNVTRFEGAGTAFFIVPADANAEPAALIGDYYLPAFSKASGIAQIRTFPIWVETTDISLFNGTGKSLQERLRLASGDAPLTRPATFDPAANMALLNRLLAELGLDNARIAVETGSLSAPDFRRLQASCPRVHWLDGSNIVARLRMFKSAAEISRLERAAAAAQFGVQSVLEDIREGMDSVELGDLWKAYATAKAMELVPGSRIDAWASVTIGKAGYGPGNPLKTGDIIKMDVGTVIDGYSSDSARTFSFGRPGADAATLYQAVASAYAKMVEELNIGTRLCDLYRSGLAKMHSLGFDRYRRGHFGHSLGAGGFTEEWPFISRDEEETVQADMVLAVEVPWYIRGLGAFMIEDQFTIGRDGISKAWTLPAEMVVL
ncbi:MAG: Xaa-Pro peptidase family protein [Desulfobacterales bacterium]|nr:Xaa-Pro peptidase family protein [Desulfobacterales bacterium]